MSEIKSRLDRVQAETLGRSIASYLQAKTFEKNPHIGLIGPGTRGAEADPLDLLTETVEEQTEQWLSPFVSGFRLSMKRIEGAPEKKIKVCYSFHMRVSAPSLSGGEISESDQFRAVDLCFVIKNEALAEISLVIFDGSKQNVLYSKNIEINLKKSNGVSVQVPLDQFSDARKFLTTSMEVGYGQQTCQGLRFQYQFSLTAFLNNTSNNKLELLVKLTDHDGNFVNGSEKILPIDDKNKKCRVLVDRFKKSWSVAQLHELQSVVSVSGYEFTVKPTEHGIAGIRPINCVYDLESINEGEIRFRDFVVVPEHGRSIKQSDSTVSEFLSELVKKHQNELGLAEKDTLKIVKAASAALSPLIGNSEHLYTFQEDCARKVLEAITEDRPPAYAVPMGVQTAGGKTLGFLTPLSIFSYATKCVPNPIYGVKAILFYPTKALINDQADTIVKLLLGINKSLIGQGYTGPPLTFGVLHGDIDDKKYISSQLTRSNQAELTKKIRLKCPLCSSPLQIKYERVGVAGVSDLISCTGERDSSCLLANNQNEISFFNKMVKATRNASYSDPPDLLVCTPDMLNMRLFSDPSEHSIFGRNIKRCKRCDYATARFRENDSCELCGNELDGPIQFSSPKIFVFDEAHQLRGSFGSQVSHVMSRVEKAAKTLSNSQKYNPVYVFSSATLARPQHFIKDFFGMDVPSKDLVKAEYLDESSVVQRIHLFMVPKGYSPEATLVQTVRAAFYNFPFKDRYPNILIFVNSLAESNELINLLRHHSASFRDENEHPEPPLIDGHSTDFGNNQRENVEDKFTNGKINVLVATSTLQVGVDFDRIDMLIVYGAPYFLSDYVQRIGRAGRKHPAVIASILPSKPIDFFFFGNYPLITELAVRDKALNAEAVRVSRDNETIRKRSSQRALLDYLCTRPDAPRYYHEIGAGKKNPFLYAVFTPEKASLGPEALGSVTTDSHVNPELYDYIKEAIRSELDEDEKRAIRKTIDQMVEALAFRGVRSVSELFKQHFLDTIYAVDLRQSDYVVTIDHPDLANVPDVNNTTRDRALAIAIGDYCTGQVTSYQSRYFVVDNIETNPSMSSAIRNSIYSSRTAERRSDL